MRICCIVVNNEKKSFMYYVTLHDRHWREETAYERNLYRKQYYVIDSYYMYK